MNRVEGMNSKQCTVSPNRTHFYEIINCLYCGKIRPDLESQEQAEDLSLCKACGKMAHHTAENCPTKKQAEMVLEPSIVDWQDNNSPTPKAEGWEDKRTLAHKYESGRNYGYKIGYEAGRKLIGKNKRCWFNKGVREGQEEERERIWKWAIGGGITDKKSFVALRDFLK